MASLRDIIAGLATLTLAATLAGCGGVSTYGPPPAATDQLVEGAPSLIPTDAGLLSDAEIARILTTRVEIPVRMRVAVIYLEHRSQPLHSGRWSGGSGAPHDDLRLAVTSVLKLRKSDRVVDVSYLPSFLLPQEKTVPLIREAAARYQADWVLVFASRSLPRERDRLLGDDEARVTTLVECAVLDVRTGTIPFTSTAVRERTEKKRDDDYSLADTRLRAEMRAIDAAMGENVDNLLRFLGRVTAGGG